MGNRRLPGWLRAGLATLTLCAVPVWLAAQQPAPGEPAQKLEQVKQTLESKQAELKQKFGELKDNDERMKVYQQFQATVKQLLGDARAIAESAAGTETAADAWAFVLSNASNVGDAALAEKALEVLMEKHLASPAWKDLSPTISYLMEMGINEDKAEKALRTLMEKSPHKSVQAGAMCALGTALLEKEDATAKGEGRELLLRVQKDFADVKEAKEFVARAEGSLFQLEKLQLGMPCPDFEASDETGTKFKLSDYKGKVVLIDFWGYW